MCWKAKSKSQKLSPIIQTAENLLDVSSSFSSYVPLFNNGCLVYLWYTDKV